MAATQSDGSMEEALERRDWRVWFGLAATLSWLVLGFLYIDTNVGWENLAREPADALGSFLEGAFAPLAFLWLVIGFFIQQRELRNNNLAIQHQNVQMRRAAEHAEVQARAITANELHQRQETFLMVADRVQRQLGSVVGLLWMSSQGPGMEGATSTEEDVADLWSRLGTGDPEAFGRQFMGVYFRRRGSGQGTRDLFFGTEIRTRHSENILFTFGRLLEMAAGCDPDGIIQDAIRGSSHGRLYEMILAAKEGAD